MDFRAYLKENTVYLDGGMGTLVADKLAGDLPERLNISDPELITGIHKAYFDAGSNVVNTNTFGANLLKYSKEELETVIRAAVENAAAAKKQSKSKGEKFIALDIGPTGKLLKPYGDFDFEDAVSVFAETVRTGIKYGVDLVTVETMNDLYETKAALLAVKENCRLPVIVTNAYGSDGKLMTGASPDAVIAMLEGMGADAIGVNCSFGPEALAPVVLEYLRLSSLPVVMKPNAGMPRSDNGKTVYDVSPDSFAETVTGLLKKGLRVAGGCCGTTPEYIRSLTEKAKDIRPVPITEKDFSAVSSYTHAVYLGGAPVLIGERINPTGKKRLKQALTENDLGYILSEGIREQEKGADILDVNVGLPEIDEAKMLSDAVCELQAVIDLPLQIDTSNPAAMERALRRYNGKAMINSVNGKEESMRAVFPLAKKYGGLIVALTLDENGIPDTAEGRAAIAEKIIKTAAEYGIKKKDLVFDTLTMAVSAMPDSAEITLGALRDISSRLGCRTVLGVSNISFGLPGRDLINSIFFTEAMSSGLSAAIMNPDSAGMMNAYRSFCALHGFDENFGEYIKFAESTVPSVSEASVKKDGQTVCDGITSAIIKGLKGEAAALTDEALKTDDPLVIVREKIIPALDTVGIGFEQKKVYLPQLLMSAEAAKAAFERIKVKMSADGNAAKGGMPIVLATVKGDIHDIGKNIVKLLLENYGFFVSDLGKDVEPELILDEVIRLKAPLVGLSALMTTTVPAMEETVKLIKKYAPWCKTVVGGAVLNEDYAKLIGADKYAPDAMDTVRYAEGIKNGL